MNVESSTEDVMVPSTGKVSILLLVLIVIALKLNIQGRETRPHAHLNEKLKSINIC